MPSLPPTRSAAQPEPGSLDAVPVLREDDDRTLVAHALGDRDAFDALYHRYFDSVYWYCFGRLRTEVAAEDATSQVFAKALAALPRYREHESATAFRAWLFRIAHNVVIDEVRARRPYEPLTAARDIPDPVHTPEAAVLREETHQDLWNLVATLPPNQRQIVELRLAGLTGAEIATVLGRTRGAVDTAQSRAVAHLRMVLGIPKAARREETRHAPR